MKNPKQTVALRRYQDGTLVDILIERRVIRERKDGTRYLIGHGGSKPELKWDAATNMWYWEIHWVTGRAFSFAEVVSQMKAKMAEQEVK